MLIPFPLSRATAIAINRVRRNGRGTPPFSTKSRRIDHVPAEQSCGRRCSRSHGYGGARPPMRAQELRGEESPHGSRSRGRSRSPSQTPWAGQRGARAVGGSFSPRAPRNGGGDPDSQSQSRGIDHREEAFSR